MSFPDEVRRRPADSPRVLGEINDRIVFDLLYDTAPLTRLQISELTGLSKQTTAEIISRLTGRRLITVVGRQGNKVGPRAQLYGVEPSAAHVIGLHAGPGTVTAELATLTGDPAATCTVAVPESRDADLPGVVFTAVNRLLQSAGLGVAAVDRIVIATPGAADPFPGTAVGTPSPDRWGVPGLFDALATGIETPILRRSEVDSAAVAEGVDGAARGCGDYVLLWLGPTVQAALVTAGAPRTSTHAAASRIAQLALPDPSDSTREATFRTWPATQPSQPWATDS